MAKISFILRNSFDGGDNPQEIFKKGTFQITDSDLLVRRRLNGWIIDDKRNKKRVVTLHIFIKNDNGKQEYFGNQNGTSQYILDQIPKILEENKKEGETSLSINMTS